MERWAGTVAVVTGASAGIGAVISQQLVERGVKVVGLARRTEKIEELAEKLSDQPGSLYSVQCDVSNEEDILKAFEWTSENVGPVHILINSAGVTRPTNLTDGSTEDWKKIFDINVIAVCICCREAIRIMKRNDIAGHIINLNSVVGHYVPPMPEPVFNVYPASKFAITALTESLRQELRYEQTKIKVTSISPGMVRTEFQSNLPENTQEALTMMPCLKPEQVSDAVMYVLSTDPDVQIHELIMKPLGELY